MAPEWIPEPEPTETRILIDKIIGYAFTPILLIVLALGIIGMVASESEAEQPHCHEDEVIIWDGSKHGLCYPLDDLLNRYADESAQPQY